VNDTWVACFTFLEIKGPENPTCSSNKYETGVKNELVIRKRKEAAEDGWAKKTV